MCQGPYRTRCRPPRSDAGRRQGLPCGARSCRRRRASPRTGFTLVVSNEMALDLPPTRQARSRRTQQRILDAGTALLEEGGTEAHTVAAVAARAGVSVRRRLSRRSGHRARRLPHGHGPRRGRRRTRCPPAVIGCRAVSLPSPLFAPVIRCGSHVLRAGSRTPTGSRPDVVGLPGPADGRPVGQTRRVESWEFGQARRRDRADDDADRRHITPTVWSSCPEFNCYVH
jgi:hypothetical protein